MYQATGRSRSWANTAIPRPHRRPVHNAQPAASTAEPITTNQPAVPYPLKPGGSSEPPRWSTTSTAATTTAAAPSSATTTPA